MEWPSEVVSGKAFEVRLTGYGVDCRQIFSFSLDPKIDNSAVTFEPYFVVSTRQQVCPLAVSNSASSSPIAPNFDTLTTVAGLSASSPRTYEMRASANVTAGIATPGLPVRTFGTILVRPDTANSAARRNAGGSVFTWRDTSNCLHLSPLYVVFLNTPMPSAIPIGPGFTYVVENPPDTTSNWSGFVQGYVYTPVKPICGENEVFHLVTRE